MGEYISDLDLKQFGRTEPVGPNIFCQILEAMCHLWSNQIVYIGIKDQCVMLHDEGKAKRVKIIDFGVSQKFDAVAEDMQNNKMFYKDFYCLGRLITQYGLVTHKARTKGPWKDLCDHLNDVYADRQKEGQFDSLEVRRKVMDDMQKYIRKFLDDLYHGRF